MDSKSFLLLVESGTRAKAASRRSRERQPGKRSTREREAHAAKDFSTKSREIMNDLPPPTDMKKFFIMSSDSFSGTLVDQKIPSGWSDSPPLFPQGDEAQQLKEVQCRNLIRMNYPTIVSFFFLVVFLPFLLLMGVR